MATTITTRGGVQVLRPDGDLSGANVPLFRQSVETLLARDERDYLVDLTLAQTVDSTGLEALTWLHRSSEERLGSVKLCQVNPTVETILKMTRLAETFERHPNVEAALASFG
ncbi:MAG TPA: STAS domain-containing protein [Phycisphaerae bacterium]|nr:STAS domain-containing protein [Phycisphaerae bacterium]HNU46638.1 STAS domain-containing protein [Phycisphaerae bacterium]